MDSFPLLTLLATIASTFLGVYALNSFTLSLIAAKKILSKDCEDADPPAQEPLPTVTIQIPIYNEGPLIESVLENVTSLDYPKDRLEIQILDDSTDAETLWKEQKLVEKYGGEGYDLRLIHRENRGGYKAGALNNGLKMAKGDYIAVVDADTYSPGNFLMELIPQFSKDERLAFVQARCEYTDRWFNWITESNAIERDVHHLIEQPAKSWYNLLPNFSGKAGIWRRDILEKYGWDESVLTEDIELSYRVQLDGWKSLYLHHPTCMIELPLSLTALKTQQMRWTAGFAQSFRKLWRPLIKSRELTRSQKLETLIFLFTPITHIVALAAIFVWMLAAILEPEATLGLWLNNPVFSIFIASISIAPNISVIMAILRSRERTLRKLLTIPLTIIMATANLIANAKGALQGFFRKNLIFEKTAKYGITQNNRKHKAACNYTIGRLIKENSLELIAAILVMTAIAKLLLQGQTMSSVPLAFIALSWLISVFQK